MVAAGGVCFALVLYLALAPFVALYQIGQAVKTQDVAAISDSVDFPMLRESVKSQFSQVIARRMQNSGNDAFAVAGTALGGALLNAMVDNLLTPSGFIAFANTGRFGAAYDASAPDSTTGDSTTSAESSKPRLDFGLFGWYYRSFDRFSKDIRDSNGSLQLQVSLCRYNLVGWRLCEISMPGFINSMQNSTADGSSSGS